MYEFSESIYQDAVGFLIEAIKPIGDQLDHDSEKLKTALESLYSKKLGALQTKPQQGAITFEEKDYSRFQMEASRVSAALEFLQVQHQSAARFISKSGNTQIQKEYILPMSRGDKRVGLGYSQLRRSGPPQVTAEKTTGGYLINGEVPWVTGESFFDEFILGATNSDGDFVFGIAPLSNIDDQIICSPPLKLLAINSTRTVTIKLNNYLLPDKKVITIKKEGLGKGNALTHGFSALGCAKGAIDHCKELLQKMPSKENLEAINILEEQLASVIQEALDSIDLKSDDEKIRIRAKCNDIASKCTYAGVILTAGKANLEHNRAQRFYKESLLYTVTSQTPEIRSAALKELVCNSF